ncbi:MAG: DUF6129 family protein [Thiobacillaceae bacterium]|jgi:hypothetical protein
MITAETLLVVYNQAAVHGPSEAILQSLRKAWPDVHFTLCSDDDVPARLSPAVEGETFNIYLVSNAEHCVAFTNHLEAATGLVLATQSEE